MNFGVHGISKMVEYLLNDYIMRLYYLLWDNGYLYDGYHKILYVQVLNEVLYDVLVHNERDMQKIRSGAELSISSGGSAGWVGGSVQSIHFRLLMTSFDCNITVSVVYWKLPNLDLPPIY